MSNDSKLIDMFDEESQRDIKGIERIMDQLKKRRGTRNHSKRPESIPVRY